MLTERFSKAESYAVTTQTEPLPLFGELRKAEPIPWQALGPLADSIQAIATLTQAPAAIAMQSVLTVASVATQALADVETLLGFVPLSCFALTVAQSGERKSACDSLATSAIDQIDRDRVRSYNLAKRKFETDKLEFQKGQRRKPSKDFEVIENESEYLHDALPPEPPLFPAIRIGDPTIEGLFRQLEIGTPSVGVMTDEGGQFFGGHGMKHENVLKTSAGFSKLWDGKPLSKSRASSEPSLLCGKRVSLHLMIQPGIAQNVVGDPTMKDQGLLSRVLIAWPDSKIGTRIILGGEAQSNDDAAAKKKLDHFDARVTELLKLDLPTYPGTRSDLQPRQLELSNDARDLLVRFFNRVEEACGVDKAFEYMTGFAGKAAEMAARIAGVQTIFSDATATVVTSETMSNGVEMMEWYLAEMLRIMDTGRPDQELCEADKMRLWLLNNWQEDFIDKRTLMKKGPGHLRDGNTLKRIIQKLEEYGWLVRSVTPELVDGSNSRTNWKVVRPGSLT